MITPRSHDDGFIDVGRTRLRQVFGYLQALDQLKNPVRRAIEEQPWSYWLRDLPDHPAILRGVIHEGNIEEDAGDDFILRVSRPRITYGPQVPQELEDWVVIADRGDPESVIEVHETINVSDAFGETIAVPFENPIRAALLAEWRRRWDQWAENEHPARRALKVFERLYELHGQLEREGERVELVLGDGILHWRRREGPIRHPLLIQPIQLEFAPSVPEFTLRETDQPVQLYSAVFRGLDDVDGAALATSQDQLDTSLIHPLGASATGFLRALAARLSAHGQYLDDPAISAGALNPEIYRDPVLFVRSRTLGFASALEALREDLSHRTDLPVSLLNIVGKDAPPQDDSPDGQTHSGPANEIEDVLLSKPANPEQVQIARRLQQYGAVLVQGPPGTGKTHTIGNLLGHLLAQGKSVLVTSHTSKALRVLHDQIVPQLQPLCVSVLGSDSENREGLERAVAGIAERLSSSAEQLESDAARLEAERSGLLRRLVATRQALLTCLSGEYQDIVIAGEVHAPAAAARLVAQGARSDGWIPGRVEPGAPLPLSPGEVNELYRTNIAVADDDEREIDARLPEPSALPSPEAFAEAVVLEARLRDRDRTTGARFWSGAPSSSGAEGLKRLQHNAEAVLETLNLDDWQLAIVQAGWHRGIQRQSWDDLIAAVEKCATDAAVCEQHIAEFGPQLPATGDPLAHEQILDAMLTHIGQAGWPNFWALIRHPEWKRLLQEAGVDGRGPTRPEHLRALRAILVAERLRSHLRARWDRLVRPIGGPTSEKLGDKPEQPAGRLRDEMLRYLDWPERVWTPFEAELIANGFDWPALLQQTPPDLGTLGDLARLYRGVSEGLLPALNARLNTTRLHVLESEFAALSAQLLQATGEGGSALVHDLRQKVAARDVSGYADTLTRLFELHARASVLELRRLLLSRLEIAAPEWSNEIRSRLGVHGSAKPPGDPRLAWCWRQLAQELDRRAATSPEELQRQIEDLRRRLQHVTAELIDRRAWAAQVRRVGLPERQALGGWLQTVKKIGKGTGKRAPRLMAEARHLMAQCRAAVPVWVMPLARVVENFDPRMTRFDVVIIDEASQSDIMALVALYFGRQVLVVGDHEQVSPDAVAQNLTSVQQLITQHLREVPNGHLYDGQTSVYDLAQTSFGGTICLLEHFRCVPEIIQFSNALSYGGQLKPLRDGSSVHVKPALVAHRVNGCEIGHNVNPEEAITVATLIAAAIEQPEYVKATFGVISLVGDRQALEVDRLLRTHLPPIEYERRRIVCGNAAQFQGDERDVMFLSVVDTSDGGPLPLRDRPLFKKRFNVAASRARDQMWVIHSLQPEVDLKPEDLRRRLIQHALDPNDLMLRLAQVEQRVESEFERRVAQDLVAAGFRVVPQWRVGYYRIDLVVVGEKSRLAVECDGDRFHSLDNLPNDLERQATLERLGWTFVRVRGSQYFRDPDAAMRPVFERLAALGISPEDVGVEAAATVGDELRDRVIRRAAEIRREWDNEPHGPPGGFSGPRQPEPPASKGPYDAAAADVGQPGILAVVAHDAPGWSGEPDRADPPEPGRIPWGEQRRNQTKPRREGPERMTQRTRKKSDPSPPPVRPSSTQSRAVLGPSAAIDLPAIFESRGIPWRDNRARTGGSFWVTGGPELQHLMDKLTTKGIHFRFTANGSRATGQKPGWFLPPPKAEG